MNNPQGPPNDPTAWGRPGKQNPFGAPTERMRGVQPPGGQSHQPTMPGQLPGRTEQFGAARANAQQPGYSPPPVPPRPPSEPLATPKQEPATPKKKGRLRSPLSIFLVLILVLAVVVGGLIAAEFIVRGKATKRIAEVAACKTQDEATVSIGAAPLMLWQLATDHFTNISVDTKGNHLRDAQGMKLQLKLNDIRLNKTPDSKGTIGSIDATITWTADGIRDTVKNAIPLLGPFVARHVTTHPNDGTIEMKGVLEDIVAKPVVSNGGIRLEIQTFHTVGGISLISKKDAQSKLDGYTNDLTNKLPLGIRADNIHVTSNAVVAHFAAQNSNLPADKTEDPCFANL